MRISDWSSDVCSSDLELETDLRREVRLTRRIIVVAARNVDLELFDDRRAHFEESRLHITAAGGAHRVDRIITIILVAEGAGVGTRGINRLVAIRHADCCLQLPAGKLDQILGQRALNLPQFRARKSTRLNSS